VTDTTTADSLPEAPAVAVTGTERVVGVVPDVPALDRVLDYLVPDGWLVEQAPAADESPSRPAGVPTLRLGSVVRIPLQGRRVRGWVVDLAREPAADVRLRPLAKVTGWGPPPDLLELGEWAAWRWSGRRLAFLRAATPERAVTYLPERRRLDRGQGLAKPATAARPAAEHPDGPAKAFESDLTVVRLPPDADELPWIAAGMALGQTLVLAPGHDEVSQLSARLRGQGVQVARHPEGWASAATGQSVVGSRAAAWMPAPDLRAVVVIDEHDQRYQEERAPTWNARDVAIERARRAGVPCVLLSPVPSLEALVAGRLLVPSRAEERANWPIVEVVDRTTDDDPHRHGLYSPRLVSLLRSDARVAVVFNRTGRARLLACQRCSRLATCERCQAALASVDQQGLLCPRCDFQRPLVCEKCGDTRFRLLRAGVARVREELEALAGEPVTELTAASAPDVARHAGRLTVGTAAVLHRLEHADVVVFLDLDADLCAPRFRASDQVLGQLALAARLTGGRRAGGRLLLQTRQPHHDAIQAVLHADPGRYARAEAVRRRELALPPFCALAEFSGPGAAAVAAALALRGNTLLGPIGDRYLVKAPDHASLANALAAVGRPAERVRIAVDPLDV
jgi:primosomal protein N' (replication factor Y)